MFIEIDCECLADFALRNHGVAEHPANYLAAQPVFSGKMVTTHRRHPALSNRLLPCCKLAKILRVCVAKSADRGHAHTIEIGAGLGRIALKISVQRSARLRGG